QAQNRGENGDNATDLEARGQRFKHVLVGEHLLVPLRRKAREREGDEDRVIEGEDRQKQHGHIEEKKKGPCETEEPATRLAHARLGVLGLHRMLRTAMRMAAMKRTTRMATPAIAEMASAAPSGQSLSLPN